MKEPLSAFGPRSALGKRKPKPSAPPAPPSEVLVEDLVRKGATLRSEAVVLEKAIRTGDHETVHRVLGLMDDRALIADKAGDRETANATRAGRVELAKATGIPLARAGYGPVAVPPVGAEREEARARLSRMKSEKRVGRVAGGVGGHVPGDVDKAIQPASADKTIEWRTRVAAAPIRASAKGFGPPAVTATTSTGAARHLARVLGRTVSRQQSMPDMSPTAASANANSGVAVAGPRSVVLYERIVNSPGLEVNTRAGELLSADTRTVEKQSAALPPVRYVGPDRLVEPQPTIPGLRPEPRPVSPPAGSPVAGENLDPELEPPQGNLGPYGHVYEGQEGRHIYTRTTDICEIGQGPCSVEYVFLHLVLGYGAPNQQGAAYTGKEVEVIGFEDFGLLVEGLNGVPLGTVRQEVNWENFTVTNHTVEGKHMLHPGYVTRMVVQEGNTIRVVTIGEGIGPYGTFNEILGPVEFTRLDLKLRAAIEAEIDNPPVHPFR